MDYLDPQERANRAAVLLAKERYNMQLAPFVRKSAQRFNFVQGEVDRVIEECSKECGANRDYVKSHLMQILADAVAVSEPEHQELKYKTDGEGLPPESEAPVEPLADVDGLVKDDVTNDESVLDNIEPDARVDLNSETMKAASPMISDPTDPNYDRPAPDEGGKSPTQFAIEALRAQIATAEDVAEQGGGVDPTELNRLYAALDELEGEDVDPYEYAERGLRGGSTKDACFRCDKDNDNIEQSDVCTKCTSELLEKAADIGVPGTVPQTMVPADPNQQFKCNYQGCDYRGNEEEVRNHINAVHLNQQGGGSNVAPYNAPQPTNNSISPYGLQSSVDKEALTRMHFTELARLLRESGASSETIGHFADYLATQNPRFDRDRFIAAASPEADVENSLVDTPTISSVKEAQPGDQMDPTVGPTPAPPPPPAPGLPERQKPVEAPPKENAPTDRFEDMVQNLADRAAAREFSKPSEEEIQAIASQLNVDADELRNTILGTAQFGDFKAVNGELADQPVPDDYQEVAVDGAGGHVSSHEALVSVDAVLQKVAEESGQEASYIYDLLKDKFGGVELPDRYHASVSGDHRFYLPASMLNVDAPVTPEQQSVQDSPAQNQPVQAQPVPATV
jgi:hypothetical protein